MAAVQQHPQVFDTTQRETMLMFKTAHRLFNCHLNKWACACTGVGLFLFLNVKNNRSSFLSKLNLNVHRLVFKDE